MVLQNMKSKQPIREMKIAEGYADPISSCYVRNDSPQANRRQVQGQVNGGEPGAPTQDEDRHLGPGNVRAIISHGRHNARHRAEDSRDPGPMDAHVGVGMGGVDQCPAAVPVADNTRRGLKVHPKEAVLGGVVVAESGRLGIGIASVGKVKPTWWQCGGGAW